MAWSDVRTKQKFQSAPEVLRPNEIDGLNTYLISAGNNGPLYEREASGATDNDRLSGALRVMRRLLWSGIVSSLVSALLVILLGTSSVNATLRLASFSGPVCIEVAELSQELTLRTRNDLADRVSRAVQAKIRAIEGNSKRRVTTWPNCIQPDQPGFDNQISLNLSVKTQTTSLDGQEWNVVVAGGVSRDGLIQERNMQPVLIIKQGSVSDDSIVGALVEFVDRTVIASLRDSPGRERSSVVEATRPNLIKP